MSTAKMQLEDWLDDLCVRFIINLPEEDLSSVARICFQIEEAQWFYEDFVRPLDPTLPSMSLRSFSLRIFQHCPLLAPFSVENHTKAFEEFLQYKTRVPVRGAILLNEAMDSTILVKGWKKGANWSFPRGKINKDEDDLECAIREVYEETGYDLRASGLVPNNDELKYIEITMREQQMRLYVFRNVPMETHFQPRTRKEISKIQWYKLSELPAFRKKGTHNAHDAAAAVNANKFYMVAPFLVPLKKWVVQQKKKDAARAASQTQFNVHSLLEEPVTEDDVWSRTEPTVGSAYHKPALDTLEGATRELQRLLKVQLPSQGAQPPTTGEIDKDKGGALLAILQANTRAAQAAVPAHLELHTPLDQMIQGSAPPTRPHHQHQPQQRAPLASYQPPPAFHITTDPSISLPSGHQSGIMATAGLHMLQDPPVTINPPYSSTHPPLRHPQPLPPHVQQSLLSRGATSDPTPPLKMPHEGRHQVAVHQNFSSQTDLMGSSALQQRPTQLTSQSLALLDVLKSGSKPIDMASSQVSQHRTPPSAQLQTLTSILHTHGQFQTQLSAKVPATISINQPADTTASARGGRLPSEQHRSTLLQMFKARSDSQPPAEKVPAVTSVTNTLSHLQIMQELHSGPSTEVGFGSSLDYHLRNSALANQQLPFQSPSQHLSRDTHISSSGPSHRESDNLAIPSQSRIRHSTLSAETSAPSLPNQNLLLLSATGGSNGRQVPGLSPEVASSYHVIGQDKPMSLASPPSTSSLPAPAGLQRRPEMSGEQRQKLLSLFGKPRSSSPMVGKEDGSKVARPLGGENGPHARVAPLASGTGQVLPDAALRDAHRRSQTPISPADRSFLLGYLASVTNSPPR